MGSTLIEKIFAHNIGADSVKAGDIITVNVDRVMIHDIFIPFVKDRFEEMGFTKIWDPDRTVLIYDHLVPASQLDDPRHHHIGDDFCDKYGVKNVHRCDGICHQLMTEAGYVKPGDVAFGTDSHTVTYGCVGAFSTGVGSTDLAAGIATGQAWFKIPEAIRFELKGKLFDTMIAHYILQPELPHNMDDLAEHYLHYTTVHITELIGPKGKDQKNMRSLEPAAVKDYAAEDADITLRLYNVLRGEVAKGNMTSLLEDVEMPLVQVLAAMETAGVRIDTESLGETSRLYTERMNTYEKQVQEMAGEKFNISSPRQVGQILFEKLQLDPRAKKTKTGQYSTTEEVLEKLRNRSPIVDLILKYRGMKKLISTYLDALPRLINPLTGKIHTSFNQTITATGRLSSSNPNLQNIPVRGDDGKEIRKAFIPDDGCSFFSADYSQIELRIMAHFSGDEHMRNAFIHGEDIHAATAAKIWHKAISEVTPDERRKAKTANFGIIYGISPFGLSERLNIPRTEAKELIDNYFTEYPKIQDYIERSISEARAQGYIETILHRRRYLPDINSGNAVVRGYAERNAVNAPIQGSAADIIKIAMVRIYRRFTEEGLHSQMILQVHDELNFNVYPDERERVQEIVIHEMENAYPLSVPLRADFGWGANWLEAH